MEGLLTVMAGCTIEEISAGESWIPAESTGCHDQFILHGLWMFSGQ